MDGRKKKVTKKKFIYKIAAAERTKKMKFVTGVTAPICRYHPAIIAQALVRIIKFLREFMRKVLPYFNDHHSKLNQ